MIRAARLAVLAEGKFGVITSKTAACVIRYQPERVACVIDSTKRGLSAQDVLGFGGSIPVVGTVEEAFRFSPDSLLVGIAPRGGSLPDEWRPIVLAAIEKGLAILSGLHTMLGEDREISQAAARKGIPVWDLRQPEIPAVILGGHLREKTGRVILTVGSDCSTGKMTVAYELTAYLRNRGIKAEFVPTGQTGILLAGWGQAVDRVPGDFMARVVEDLVLKALTSADVAIVEGQGSLIHPAYSGVTLALMHACYAEAMILCHQPSRREIEGFCIDIPPLNSLVSLYEHVYEPVFPSKVVAVALNTYDLDETRAIEEIRFAESQTGLPTSDPVRWGCDILFHALEPML